MARIEEIDNMDKIEIIDEPNLPGRRSYPQRVLICFGTFLFSFALAVGISILRGLRTESDAMKIKEIWKALRH
jgi:uncharacterized protein involved in exopolysaccharide biosynthesis